MAGFGRTQAISHDIGPHGRFALRLTASDVEMRPSPDGTARVWIEFDIRAGDDTEADATFERARFQVDAGEGYLEVSEPRHGDGGLASLVRRFGSGSRVEARVRCEIPPEARITYAGVSADLVVDGMAGRQEYTTVSGDAVLGNVAGSIRVSSVSGDVSLRAIGSLSLRANSVSGDFSAVAPRFDDVRVTTISGDIDVDGALTDGEHRFDTVSGDLLLGSAGDMTLEVRGLSSDVSVALPHRSEGSRDRRRYVIGKAGPTVLFSSMSGDVSVGASRRFGARPPTPPTPPTPPIPPTTIPPTPPTPPGAGPGAGGPPPVSEDEQLAILRALEAGEIDVDEATRRLAGEVPHE